MKKTLFALFVLMVGCGTKSGGGGGDPSGTFGHHDPHGGAQVAMGTTTPNTAARVQSSGGTMHGTGQLAGTQVDIPPDTFAVATNVKMGTNSGTIAPSSGTWDGVILDLETDYGQEFDGPIDVTMTFADHPDGIPLPFYVNTNNELEYIDPINVDMTNRTVTFQTWHASSYAYIWARLSDPFGGGFDTGFDPQKNGFSITNGATKFNRGGECLGMAAFAGWYYMNKTLKESAPDLYTSFREQIVRPEDNSTLSKQDVIATRAYTSVQQAWDVYIPTLLFQRNTFTPEQQFLAIRSVLKNQNAPSIIAMTDPPVVPGATKSVEGHAVTAFAYVGNKVLVYDSNHPEPSSILNMSNVLSPKYYLVEYDGVTKQIKPYVDDGWTRFGTVGLGSRAQKESFNNILDNIGVLKSTDANVTFDNVKDGDHVTDRNKLINGRIVSGELAVEEIVVSTGRTNIRAPVSLSNSRFNVTVPIERGDGNYLLFTTRGKDSMGRWHTVKNNWTDSKGLHLIGDFEAATLRVTLTWDQQVDLDLYVMDPTGDSSWYVHHETDDGGELDADNTSGFGPEHFTLTSSDTTRFGQGYLVKVHKFERGNKFTNWTIQYSINDGPPLVKTGTLTLGNPDNNQPDGTGSDWGGFFEVTPVEVHQ